VDFWPSLQTATIATKTILQSTRPGRNLPRKLITLGKKVVATADPQVCEKFSWFGAGHFFDFHSANQ